jgi:hypothetical protein
MPVKKCSTSVPFFHGFCNEYTIATVGSTFEVMRHVSSRSHTLPGSEAVAMVEYKTLEKNTRIGLQELL